MGGGGHDDHHPHLMFDTTTPYQPMGEFFCRGTASSGSLDEPQRHCFSRTQALQLGVGLSRALYPPNLLHALGPRGAGLFRGFHSSSHTHFSPPLFSLPVLAPPSSFPHIPGMPLAVLVFIIGGGLAVPAFAFSHHMAMFKGK